MVHLRFYARTPARLDEIFAGGAEAGEDLRFAACRTGKKVKSQSDSRLQPKNIVLIHQDPDPRVPAKLSPRKEILAD